MDEFGLLASERDTLWWHTEGKDEERILHALNADFKHLTDDNPRPFAYEMYASVYLNRRVEGAVPADAQIDSRESKIGAGRYTRVPYNLMKQVIDEVTSRIIKTHPHARFLTHGGDPEMQRRAEMMERWNDAQQYRHYQSRIFEKCIKDACIYGLGAIQIVPATMEDRLEVSRVFPGDLFVDNQEVRRGEPQRLHRRRLVPKTTLAMKFKKKAAEIESSGVISLDTEGSYYEDCRTGGQQLVELVESWHLPTYKKAPDGYRVLWVENAILQRREYKRRSFPIVFFRWKEDPENGFYGVGLGEDLMGVHIDANVTLNRVNTAIEKAAVPRMSFVHGTVQDKDLKAIPGIKTPYSGDQPPTFYLDNSVPQDLLQYVREHEARAYKIAGLASAQAFGERVPSGLETGRAVENYFNVESIPFAEQLRKFEYLVEDVANCNMAAGKEISERNPKWQVVLPDKRNTIEVVNWKKVALDTREDSYVIRAAPNSMLSEMPAARIGEVERLQAILPTLANNEQLKAQMLGMPDLENFQDLFSAQYDNGQEMIQKAIQKGEYTPPSPFMNLEMFVVEATSAEQRAERMGINEQYVSKLRMMIRQANVLIKRRQMSREMQMQGQMTPAMPSTDASGQMFTEQQGQANV